jgi:tellurite resistance protein
MFLGLLAKEEKRSFLDLIYIAANSDGEFAEKEKAIIEAYVVEMGLSGEDKKPTATDLSEVLSNLSKSKESVKKIVVLEFAAVLMADGKYVDSEKALITQAIERLALAPEFEKTAIDWVNKIIPVYREGFEIVGLA